MKQDLGEEEDLFGKVEEDSFDINMVFTDIPNLSLIQSDIPDLNRDTQSVTEGCIPELGGIWGDTCNCGDCSQGFVERRFEHKKKAQAHPRPI